MVQWSLENSFCYPYPLNLSSFYSSFKEVVLFSCNLLHLIHTCIWNFHRWNFRMLFLSVSYTNNKNWTTIEKKLHPLFLFSRFLLQISEAKSEGSVLSVLDKHIFINHDLINFKQTEGFTWCQGVAKASCSLRQIKPQANDDIVQAVH